MQEKNKLLFSPTNYFGNKSCSKLGNLGKFSAHTSYVRQSSVLSASIADSDTSPARIVCSQQMRENPLMPDTPASASPLLVRLDDSPQTSVQLKRALTIVGSKRHSHLRIISSTVSGTHALLLNLGNNVFLRDLMARSHVQVNERQVRECRLKLGDIITFGEMRFRFVDTNVLRQSLTRIRPSPAELHCESDGHCLALDKPIMVMGRHEGADVVIDGSEISRAHAVIYEQDGYRVIRDLSSRTGTYVNEQLVRSERLRDGDFIRVGATTFRLVLPEGEADSDLALGDSTEADSGELETQVHDHVFVSEPVIVSSPTESVDLDEVEPSETAERPQPPSESESASGWYLDENSGMPLEAAMPSPNSTEPSIESVEAEGANETPSLPVPLETEKATSRQEVAPGAEINTPPDRLELADLEKFTQRPPFTGRQPSAPSNASRAAKSQKTRDAQRARNDPKKPVEELLASEVLTLFPDEAQGGEQPIPVNAPAPKRQARRMVLMIGIAFGAIAAAAAGYWYYVHHS